jgi:hypothetical protein
VGEADAQIFFSHGRVELADQAVAHLAQQQAEAGGVVAGQIMGEHSLPKNISQWKYSIWHRMLCCSSGLDQ